jgi:trigger factor
METKVEKLKESRLRTTTVIDETERADAERQALDRLASQVEIKGFRVGKAPHDKVRARVGEEMVLEETVRVLLPKVLKEAMEKSEAKPILRPAANITSKSPLTISLTFVNRPPVSVKKPEKITVEKKTPPPVTDADVSEFVNKVLLQDRTETPVEREVKKGDSVRFEMKTTKKGKPVDELTVPAYGMILGSEELLPELEPHLVGMKKGDKKAVDITFPKDHDIPAIRGEKVNVEMTLKSVSEVKIPELTQEYIKTRLQNDKTPEALRAEIKEMLAARRRDEEMKRREEELYDAIRGATSVELASELIETEVQEMVRDLHERLERQGTNVQDWLKMTGKDEKSVADEMRSIAKSRMTLRFGMQETADKLGVEPEPQAFAAALKAAQSHAKATGSSAEPTDFEKGGTVYENLRYELRMQTLKDKLIADDESKAKAA